MGTISCCGNDSRDISTFWNGLELRKITFKTYIKIFEENQMNWLNSGEHIRSINLEKCNELNKLLTNDDFTKNEQKIFIEKLNEFVNSLSDKLTFFTCLIFFTKITGHDNLALDDNVNKSLSKRQSYIETLRNSEITQNFLIIFDSILKMAIKKKEHDDVTKLFIQIVTEFAVPFVYFNKKDRDEKKFIYCKDNREKLFKMLKNFHLQKLYEYLFHYDNVSLIHNDLVKFNMLSHVNPTDELVKIRTTANFGKSNYDDTPTPGNDAIVIN